MRAKIAEKMFDGPKLFSLLSSTLGQDWEYDHEGRVRVARGYRRGQL